MADPQQLDRFARAQGFHDFATMQAYHARQQAMRLNNGIGGTGYTYGQPQGTAPTNWLQSLFEKATPLGYVREALDKVL